NRIPQAKFGRNAITEPVQHRQAIASFRRGSEPEQLARCNVLEKTFVRAGGRVVEFVDNDNVEVGWIKRIEARGAQGLNGSEHMIELPRSLATHPHLAEAGVPNGMRERRTALLQDLLS